MTPELPNHEYVANGLFVVRTQAGFKQVLNMYQDRDEHKMPVDGFPTSYPSFVTVHLGYRGHHFLEVQCWPVNLVADACKRHTRSQETPEAEGIRLAREGCGLSNVYGSVSEENFEHLEIVLDAFTQEVARHVQTI